MPLFRFFSIALAGLVITGVLTVFAIKEKAEVIENDLKSRVENNLSDYSDWVEVEVDGRNIRLSGQSPSKEELDKAIKRADGAFFNLEEGSWGVRVVQKQGLVLLPEIKPYETRLKFDGEKISLHGFLPSNKFKIALFDVLKKDYQLENHEDETKLARGADTRLDERIKFALNLLLKLEKGEATLKDEEFSLIGMSLNDKKKEQIEKEIGIELPYNMKRGLIKLDTVIKAPVAGPDDMTKLKNDEKFADTTNQLEESKQEEARESETGIVEERNDEQGQTAQAVQAENADDIKSNGAYIFSVIKNNNILLLSGGVPSDEIKASLNEKAAAFKLTDIQDKTVINEENPEGFGDAAQFALELAGNFSDGSVLITDKRIIADGTALDLKAYDKVKELSSSPPEGYVLESFSLDIPTVKPYFFTLGIQENNLEISGLASKETMRDAFSLKADEIFSQQSVEKEIRLAEGIAKGVDWQKAVEFSYLLANKIADGKVSLNDASLSVEGVAKSFESFDSLKNLLKQKLPATLEKGIVNILPPVVIPYRFKAEFLESNLALSGYVPSLQLKDELADFIKRRFVASSLSQDLTWASGAPDVYEIALKSGLQGLSRLSEGQLVVEDKLVQLSGVASFGAPINEIRKDFLDGLPADYTGEADIFPGQKPEEQKPDICSITVQQTIASNQIYFDVGRATILSDSFGLLDQLAEIVLSCPDARFEISGHTDSSGSAESNLRLSQSRAQAVADYLVRAGVPSDNFEIIGYGETRPVAKNDTAEEKALNRRIEFKLLKAE